MFVAAFAFQLAMGGGCGMRISDVERASPVPHVVASNILRGDYAGSDRCKDCHASQFRDWLVSPMRQMTRVPGTAQLRAPFDGCTWTFKDDEARFEKAAGAYTLRIHSARFGDHLYRVTRIIGGRTREDFAGVEVSAVDGRPLGDVHREFVLPVSYFFETASFRLKGYSVMVGERPGLKAGAVWNQSCVLCHNTSPMLDSLFGALLGKGAPAFQGEVVDALLPPDRRWRLQVTDPVGLVHALADETRIFGATQETPRDVPAALRFGIKEMVKHFEGGHLLEIGIGCEACHGGSREHAVDPRVVTSYEPRASFLLALAANGEPLTRAESINRTCARCHQVLFSRYPFTWEGGLRHKGTPGGSTTNSGEARDMLLGGCSKAMSCATCHDPHREDDPADLAALATAAGNATCTHCHAAYASDEALHSHAHHDPKGAGGVCINCHMPRKNLALTYTLGRYHRIGSPNETVRVEQDRPLECSLCHAEKSSEEVLSTMETWWGKHYDRQALRALYGDLAQTPLMATLARGKPHEQAVAIISMREQNTVSALPHIARLIAHPIPLVRYQARKTIDAFIGKECGIDLDGKVGDIVAATLRCVPQAYPIPMGAAAEEGPPALHDNE
jgi:hypothetical protein